jgi:hypothetical protein
MPRQRPDWEPTRRTVLRWFVRDPKFWIAHYRFKWWGR